MCEIDLLEWYDSLAPSYNGLYGDEQRAKYVKVLNELGGEAHEQLPNILDSGCGTGKLFAELARRGWRGYYLGIDLSVNQLLQASEYFKKLGNDFLIYDLVAGDLRKPPLRKDAFNFIFSFTVVRDEVSDLGIVNNLRRLIGRNGVLVYTILSSKKGVKEFEGVCRGACGELTRLESYCIEVWGDEG